jgi:hypothetical protein
MAMRSVFDLLSSIQKRPEMHVGGSSDAAAIINASPTDEDAWRLFWKLVGDFEASVATKTSAITKI